LIHALVLADTHIRRGWHRRLPDAVYSALEQADVILHAGDVCDSDCLEELAGFAPVKAVFGNNDHELVGVLPERRVEEIEGVRIGLVHIPRAEIGRAARMRGWFPEADIGIYGHSHLPENRHYAEVAMTLFNPGSATERRRAPRHTIGWLHLEDGTFRSEIVAID
jgi:putative phosphoesterase